MNPELQQRISHIKAECEEILRLGEKATPGPMKAGTKGFTIGGLSYTPKNVGTLDIPVTELDLAFIAHSRNVSPAMARVVVMVIDDGVAQGDDVFLEIIANQWEVKQ